MGANFHLRECKMRTTRASAATKTAANLGRAATGSYPPVGTKLKEAGTPFLDSLRAVNDSSVDLSSPSDSDSFKLHKDSHLLRPWIMLNRFGHCTWQIPTN